MVKYQRRKNQLTNSFSTLQQQLSRHGLWLTLRARLVALCRQLFGLHLCVVTDTHNKPNYPCPAGYSMRVLGAEAVQRPLSGDSESVRQFVEEHAGRLLAGNRCVITLWRHEVVGYNFYAAGHTDVAPGVNFEFPPDYFYSYKAFTDPQHRGLGLAPARWTCFRQWREQHNLAGPTISYIALDNLASLAAGMADDGRVLGYTGYSVRSRPPRCFRSPGANRLGAGFYAAVSASAAR